LEDGSITVYTFYNSFKKNRRDDCDIQEITIYLITVKSSFPSEYENYRDIFSPAKYIEIAENPQTAHAINLKEDIITFYRSIYHLSEKKLRVLREYLEKSQ
jgi:hypothetical protein